MRVSAPPTSGQWLFNVPPNWPSPPGFDPRKGDVADPTWPQVPPGWQFWIPASGAPVTPVSSGPAYSATYAPTARPGYQLPWLKIVIGGALALFFGVRLLGGLFGGSSSGSGNGVGSCWALDSGTTYKSVSCSSSTAQFQVVSVVADPAQCPASSESYLDTQKVGSASRYECLVPA